MSYCSLSVKSIGAILHLRHRAMVSPRFAAWTALVAILILGRAAATGEEPGAFRPQPVPEPQEKVGASGKKVQPPATLPKSRGTENVDPAYHNSSPEAPTLKGDELVLNGGWKMLDAPSVAVNDGAKLSGLPVDTAGWHKATVPGTVLTTLVDDGIYPDPYFGLNNLAIPETLNKQDYWYRTEFSVPKTFQHRWLELEFKGINYYAEVWLNGRYLGHITGAFCRGQFDITQFVRPLETNVLAVMVAPPPDPGTPSEQSESFGPGDNGGRLCLDGPTFVCTEGWDWIPAIRDRDTGIWQDVVIRASGPVTIEDPHVITELPLPDTSTAAVTVEVAVTNRSTLAQQGRLQGAFEGVKFDKTVTLSAGESKLIQFTPADFPQLTVKHPRLWWPNGYGRPELYHLQLAFVTADGKVSDESQLRFGVREMSYELGVKQPDGGVQRLEFIPAAARHDGQAVIDHHRAAMDWKGGWSDEIHAVSVAPGAEHSAALRPAADPAMHSFLVVKVNGQRIFCDGGNWGMDDALKRISRERLEPFIRLHRDAHLTMIRNWVGQSTSEAFYDLCDEYGILVWNDFWMSTEGWNFSPADHELFLHNVAETIKRYRNHPSIALWCGRNEGVPPEEVNAGNDELIRTLDGTRYYQPNSRLINLRTSGPWAGQPLEAYFKGLNSGFSTEMGAPSVPSAEVMRSMMAPEDLWPPGDVWAYHDLHSRGALSKKEFLRQMSERYGEVTNLDDLCRKSQMFNYDTYRAVFEGFDSRLWNDCSGVLLWMSHPSWPSVVWQLYSWDYEPNASYFGAKKASEPVHIQMNLPNDQVAVVNHRIDALDNLVAEASVYRLTGESLGHFKRTVSIPANACTNILALTGPQSGAYLVKLELRDGAGHQISENFYWHAHSPRELQALNSLPPVQVKASLRSATRKQKTAVECELTNPSRTPALAIRLTLRDAATGKRVLPVYYDDNYVSLLPGERRKVRIETDAAVAKPEIDTDGWNIEPAVIR